MNSNQINQVIRRYPLIFPRFYVFIRSLILPVVQLESFIPSQGKILDVGCGYGFIAHCLSLSAPMREITGTDINSHRISIAKLSANGYKNLKFKIINLIPVDQKYNCILAVDLFHHLSGAEKITFAKLCRQALSKNGTLVLKEIDPANKPKYFVNLIHDKITTGFQRLEYWPSAKMLDFFSLYGFKLINTVNLLHPLYPHKIYVFQ
jgi:2-polyprenyl-3-methyl-5-hydroxy-6-metoxy-1,4-benzoquinol methylase